MSQHLSTDVLVIGAGGAGMYAALEASRCGAKVVLADRGSARLRARLRGARLARWAASVVLLGLWIPLVVSGVALVVYPSTGSFTAYAHLVVSVWWTGLLLWHLRRYLRRAIGVALARRRYYRLVTRHALKSVSHGVLGGVVEFRGCFRCLIINGKSPMNMKWILYSFFSDSILTHSVRFFSSFWIFLVNRSTLVATKLLRPVISETPLNSSIICMVGSSSKTKSELSMVGKLLSNISRLVESSSGSALPDP